MNDQFDTLVGKLLDGEFDPTDRDRLNELLSSEENRQRFVELSKLHFCLAQKALPIGMVRTARAASAVHDSILALANAHVHSTEFEAVRKANRFRIDKFSTFAYAAAVVLICGLGVYWILYVAPDASAIAKATSKLKANSATQALAPKSVPQPNPVEVVESKLDANDFAARIISMSEDAVWDSEGSPADFLMRLSLGSKLKLTRGIMKLEFASQAIAVLSAPAELTILGPGKVLLKHGKLTGRSEEGNFIVETPSAYVVDVGTAFGVAVDDEARTDVVVFDGEVHVQRSPDSEQTVRLTRGMSVRADRTGISSSAVDQNVPAFDREFNGQRPNNLGVNEISLVDVICGSASGEYRTAGSIDPETGAWSSLPWSESKGVRGKTGSGNVVAVSWNPWVEGIFIPNAQNELTTVDRSGATVRTPAMNGGAWGPIWARRRLERRHDPLADKADLDVEGFWGAGTTTALLDRSRWVRDGIVGMHANVGITLDLAAIRKGYGTSLTSLRGALAHLEQSYVSQPFQPQAQATFQVYVDGELRYERTNFCRQDGDALFGVELNDTDQLLSLIVTDGNDGPIYDRVILLDPILETRRD